MYKTIVTVTGRKNTANSQNLVLNDKNNNKDNQK